jgi:hypothetical protein
MEDFHKMWATAKKHDAKSFKAELDFMMKDNTEIQKVCHLSGQCLKDSQMLSSLVGRMMKATESGDWESNMKGLSAMRELFHKAGQDCHHNF